ncbi:MAG: DUF5715 family protein [Bacteroidota bacterium]
MDADPPETPPAPPPAGVSSGGEGSAGKGSAGEGSAGATLTDASAGAPPAGTITREATRQRGSRLWRRVGLAVAATTVMLLGIRTWQGVEATFALQDRWVAEAEQAFAEIPLLSEEELAFLRRSRNARHLELARRLGVAPPETRAEADRLAASGSLVRIETDSLYTVLPMSASRPFLTASAAASLDTIAVRLRQRLADRGLPPFRFAVSSGLRSSEDQAALRGGNVNAAAGRSSHEYATTYDITYNPTRYTPAPDALPPPPRIDPRVPGPFEGRVRAAFVRAQAASLDRLAADYPSRLTAELGRVLIALEDEGLLAVVREVRQPVYHITVARPLAE